MDKTIQEMQLKPHQKYVLHSFLFVFVTNDFEMILWIKLLPEMDFLGKINLKRDITLCVLFHLLESRFCSFYFEMDFLTFKMNLVESLKYYRERIFQSARSGRLPFYTQNR